MRVLAIDVGCGTSDVLLWDSESEDENQTHMVIPSGTMVVAAEVGRATEQKRAVVFAGPLMGGGPSGKAMRRHISQGLSFYATSTAAQSFNDDLEAVTAMGVTLVPPREVTRLVDGGAVLVRSGDIRFPELLEALRMVGERAALDGCALAVQDHGLAGPGVSDRTFRFEMMSQTLARSRHLASFFRKVDDLPDYLTRAQATAHLMAIGIPLVVGDTGPAALWGASLAASRTPCLAINFGNNHTLMALVHEENVDGLFEHHTSMLDPVKMESYVRRFAAAGLTGDEVFADGGHGSIKVSRPFDPRAVEIVVTGPRRRAFACMDLPLVEAALHGDMMLTGCYGLLQGYLAKV
jgi:uncharacterized protein (DUF1786 family)